MSRYFLAVIAVVTPLVGWESLASAAALTADGDFGAQTLGSPITMPWTPNSGGGNSATVAAQSQFTNVFAQNAIGANTPTSAGGAYFVGPLSSIPAASTAPLYLNADFRNNSSETGDYAFVVTNGSAGANRTLGLYVAGNVLYAESNGGLGAPILTVSPGVWYNAQLALDMSTDNYSGSVTAFGGDGTTYAITSRGFVNNLSIDTIYSDTGINVVAGADPNHDIDNFVLSDSPLAAPDTLRRINVDFNGASTVTVNTSNIGTAQFPAGNGYFNGIGGTSFSNVALADVTGGSTGITISGTAPTQDPSQFDSTASGTAAFQDALVTLGTSITPSDPSDDVGTVTLNGLLAGRPYDLYLFGYFNADAADREAATFTVNGLTTQSTTGASSAAGFTLGQDYVLFQNVLPVAGAITISFTGGNPVRDVGVFNGLQLTYVPEPSSLGLLGLGLLGLAHVIRRRRG